MKKFISIILTISIAFTLVSCAKAQKPDWQTSLDLGQKYLLDGNYEQAIVEFNKVIEIEPKNVEAYLGLAEAYAAEGDYDSAIAVLEQGYAETDNQSLQDKINELRGLSAAQTEQSETVVSEVTDIPETVAETTDEPERVKVFWMGPSYEQYTYDEYGRCVAYLEGSIDGTGYQSTLSYQIIFSYDENGKVEKAIYCPLDAISILSDTIIEAENLYYNEQENLVVEFKAEQEDTQNGFAYSRQMSFEFSDQMWLMCINFNYNTTGESSFNAGTTERHFERDASGKISSADYYNGPRFGEEFSEVFSHYEITYDDSDLPASWAYYTEDNKVLEGLCSFEEGLLKSVIVYNYSYSLNSENTPSTTVVTYNENKKPVKITTTSPVHGYGPGGSLVQLPRTSERETNYEYDSEGKLSKITSTYSTGLGYLGYEIFEYEHAPYLSLKNVILPDYNTYEDTQQDGMIRVGYTAIDGHWYINHVEIDKEFFIPTDSAEDFHGLYIDGELLTETLDYSLLLGAGRTIWINGSAFEKIDVFENEGVHTIVTEFRNESGELLYRKALNIHLDLERLRN